MEKAPSVHLPMLCLKGSMRKRPDIKMCLNFALH